MADPLQFSDLYGVNGLAFLVSDAATSSDNDRKRAINDAYIELASIKGYWRLRTTTYTSSSSPALTSGTYQYNLPSDFDDMFRVYFREAGRYVDIDVVSDSHWLELSAVRSTDAGDPRVARITQTSSTQNRIEFAPPVSQGFIDRIGTITLEYFIEITRLVGDTDEPILPANLRHHIVTLAGLKYATAQGDPVLIQALRPEAERTRLSVLKKDLTRTGRPRQLRPRTSYYPVGEGGTVDYGAVLR